MRRRILIIDPACGAAGDMFLGALTDLGADFEALCRMLATLPAGGFHMQREKVLRGGVPATKVHVHLDALGGGEEGPNGEVIRADAQHHGGAHFHGAHGRHQHHGHHGNDGPVRGLAEIRSIIHASALPPAAKSLALHAFQLLGEAEALAHNVPVEDVHFHEVGATDAIVDICGTALLVTELGVAAVYSRPVATGSGRVRCAHGDIAVPAPATRHLLGDFPTRPAPVERELLTPTGAALLRALNPTLIIPAHRVVAEGFGAGTMDFATCANVLRLQIAEIEAAP